MNWLKAHWRKLVWLAFGAASSLVAEHTVYKRVIEPIVPPIINSIPCTPGEANCPPEK